jgi:threonine aldolase
MRFLSAQWVGLLEHGAWLRYAAHANRMTQRLVAALRPLPGVGLIIEPEVNAVFVNLPPAAAAALRREGWSFYTFIGAEGCRLMCSWDTREDDIDSFVAALKSALDGKL